MCLVTTLQARFVVSISIISSTSQELSDTFHIKQWYRVTRIIVNDFESEKLYVVIFINRQTLYHSIGMINKIM